MKLACENSTKPRPPRLLAAARVLLFLGVAAQGLFAHGCHGDDVDHELFARLVDFLAAGF